jgi:hypothetical protein
MRKLLERLDESLFRLRRTTVKEGVQNVAHPGDYRVLRARRIALRA